MIVGGYTLDLYCDRESPTHLFQEFPHQYTGENGPACRRLARRHGWRLKRNGEAICPKCSLQVAQERPE